MRKRVAVLTLGVAAALLSTIVALAASTAGGRHYTGLASPNQVSGNNDTGFAPGGGDVDVAVAPAKNATGFYNVYVASLSLANVDVSTSTDGGTTWKLNPVT